MKYFATHSVITVFHRAMKTGIKYSLTGALALGSFTAHALEPENCASLLQEKVVVGDIGYTPTWVDMTGSVHTTKPNSAILLMAGRFQPYPLLARSTGQLSPAYLGLNRAGSYVRGTFKNIQMHGGEWSALREIYVHLPSGRVWVHSGANWKEWGNVTCYRSESNIPGQLVVRGESNYGRGIDFYSITLTAKALI